MNLLQGIPELSNIVLSELLDLSIHSGSLRSNDFVHQSEILVK